MLVLLGIQTVCLHMTRRQKLVASFDFLMEIKFRSGFPIEEKPSISIKYDRIQLWIWIYFHMKNIGCVNTFRSKHSVWCRSNAEIMNRNTLPSHLWTCWSSNVKVNFEFKQINQNMTMLHIPARFLYSLQVNFRWESIWLDISWVAYLVSDTSLSRYIGEICAFLKIYFQTAMQFVKIENIRFFFF